MKSFLNKLLLFSFSLIPFSYIPCIAANPDISTRDIVVKMFSSIKHIQTLTFTLKKKERIENEMKFGEQRVKFSAKPKKVYTQIVSPNKGVELLWIDGVNDNKAYLNPNGFPYVNLYLNPYSAAMRKGNHHTIYEVGFDYISSIVSNIYEKSGESFSKMFINEGSVVFDNKPCYKLWIDYFPYKYIEYTVLPNETVTDIAYKLYISDYGILQLNPQIKGYEDVSPGQVIKVPNAYAKKTILYIDKNTFLPIVQMMYDEKGLIAQYEFHDLQLNPKIEEKEFTPEFEGYRFK